MEPRRERKVVTVLFADLVGFTARAEQLDPEDVEAILRPYHERLRGEVERFGGTVEKFIGDAVMALFGAPVAHEDDPERAVRAALAIRDWAREDDAVQVRIAVNTGEALINLGARPEAGEGMAAGDVVNTTARLQSAAPVNGVIVGETTYRATQPVIDYRDADSVKAKGKAEPLRVWEAIEPRSRVETETVSTLAPLIGREHELDQLVDALTRARREHSPQLVTLVGVPGIGKSRVVSELFAVVDADPEIIFWRHGRSLPYGDGVTFWAVAEMVKAQAGILETDTAEEAGSKLRSTLDELRRRIGARQVGSEPTAPSRACRRGGNRWGSPGRALFCVAPLLRSARRPPTARPHLRRPSLGRRRSTGLRRRACRLGGRRPALGALYRAARAARPPARLGWRETQCGDRIARSAWRRRDR